MHTCSYFGFRLKMATDDGDGDIEGHSDGGGDGDNDHRRLSLEFENIVSGPGDDLPDKWIHHMADLSQANGLAEFSMEKSRCQARKSTFKSLACEIFSATFF